MVLSRCLRSIALAGLLVGWQMPALGAQTPEERHTAPAVEAPIEAPIKAPTEASAVQRLAATLEAAFRGPALEMRRAELAAETAADRATVGAGTPSLSWQREGIGSGLDRRPNAIDYLRVSTPFHFPWERGAIRRFDTALASWRQSRLQALAGETLLDTATRWLELAAETERIEVVRERLGRFDRALQIQRKRLELGEVSGSAVTQLELERARDASGLRALQVRREALAAELATVTADGLQAPGRGDLERLVEATLAIVPSVSLPRGGELTTALEASPWLVAARQNATRASRREALARRLARGRPSFDLEWERIPDLGPGDGFDAAGFQLTIPLPFGRVERERRAEAEAWTAAADRELEAVRRRLEQRVAAVAVAAAAAQTLLDELTPALARLPEAKHSLAEQFRLGAISYLVYIDGMLRLDEVHLQVVTARKELLTARLELALMLADPTLFPLPPDLDVTAETAETAQSDEPEAKP